MLNPLEQLYVHLSREDGNASTLQVRANPLDFKDSGDDLAYAPDLELIEGDARKAGEYLGKAEELDEDDKKLLRDIINAISQIALNEDQARVQEFADGQNRNDISIFFTNSLEVSKVFVLEPLMKALRQTGNDQRVKYFLDLCKCNALGWTSFSEVLGETAMRVSSRIDEFFDDALKPGDEASSESLPTE